MEAWQDIVILFAFKALGSLLEFTYFSAEDYVPILCVKPVLQLFNISILHAKIPLKGNIEFYTGPPNYGDLRNAAWPMFAL